MRYKKLPRWRSLSTSRKVLAILLPLALISLFLWFMAENYWYNPRSFRSAHLTLVNGEADVYVTDLAKGQKLVVYFDLNPEEADISVIIGCIATGWTGYQWVAGSKDYPCIKDGSKIVFRAPNTNAYTIWMKPRAYRNVDVRINYGFSE